VGSAGVLWTLVRSIKHTNKIETHFLAVFVKQHRVAAARRYVPTSCALHVFAFFHRSPPVAWPHRRRSTGCSQAEGCRPAQEMPRFPDLVMICTSCVQYMYARVIPSSTKQSRTLFDTASGGRVGMRLAGWSKQGPRALA
jgi:hypothetical protein